VAFDAAAPLHALVAMLEATTGVQTVYMGVPESMSHRLSAFVAVAGMVIYDKQTANLQRDIRYVVGLGYRVSGAEETAEEALADALDAFTIDFYADRKLNNTVLTARLGEVGADMPLYSLIAGQEYRLLQVVIVATQQQTYDNRQP
jgi:hypothetical protein